MTCGDWSTRLPARLVVEAAERVAAADRHIHPHERQILALIRAAVSHS